MRKFVISDLHGNGNMYNIIMSYLKNIKEHTGEDITLYINGDLIDRGWDSAEMLIDIRNRIQNESDINIEYLGGNHELLMWQTYKEMKKGRNPYNSLWFDNGGDATYYCLEDELLEEKDFFEMFEFIKNLKLYKKFKETICNKNIVLVHSKCPLEVLDECDITIEKDDYRVHDIVWTRKGYFFSENDTVGNEDYFTIIGHTPIDNKYGYQYFEDENYINIDGGNSAYVLGYEDYNHTPLVEIDNEKLTILTFNNNNEIIYGNYFDGYKSISINNINEYNKFIDKNVKVKKMVKEDGMIFFR